MTLPHISEAAIRAHAAPESFQRGQGYFQRGAVGELVVRGNELQADVEGSQYPAYRVRVLFDKGGITSAHCTCPYDWGGWCKHIVAALLAYTQKPGDVVARPPLDEQLEALDRSQLQALLLGLAACSPDLANSIERQLALLRLAHVPAPTPKTPARRSTIDSAAIRQQVQFALRSTHSDRYDYGYDDEDDPGSSTIEALEPILLQAQRFVEGGDVQSGLAVLEALTSTYLASSGSFFEEIASIYGGFEGAAAEFFDALAAAWAVALLSATLAPSERNEWGEKVAGWNSEIENLGAGPAFELAVAAADQGWDYAPLQRVLAGEITTQGAWAGPPPDYADALAQVRLQILERQGRHQEYIYLAEAEGQLDRYILMLAKMGQVNRALTEGKNHLINPDEILAVAAVLREQGALEAALSLAEHGLALPVPEPSSSYSTPAEYQRAPLASWAAELAAGMGLHERAVRAAELAFRLAPSLANYQMVQEQAGERWPDIQPRLLAQLSCSNATAAKIDIFLHEGMIDEAIKAVRSSYDTGLLERVMAAALPERPEWVIEAASVQADRIMISGKADRYAYAVTWLAFARDAYTIAGRADDWRSYLRAIHAQHGRKYKLMGLIARL